MSDIVGVTVIVRVADAVSPPLSVTAAVSRCVPTESVDTVTLPPLPRAPSRFDVQVRAAVSVPSCVSLALAANPTALPAVNVALLAGDVIVTVGGVLAVVMVIVRVADAVSPPLSVTAAVSRCVPTESVDTVTLPPLPRAPSRSTSR